mmetsp:Transcript_77434/g.206763  ORF Transcript_77434/g.206763 Transcript_77434/m.206763 type:complete len:203 (-) Transcript_77434:416-1024(-)
MRPLSWTADARNSSASIWYCCSTERLPSGELIVDRQSENLWSIAVRNSSIRSSCEACQSTSASLRSLKASCTWTIDTSDWSFSATTVASTSSHWTLTRRSCSDKSDSIEGCRAFIPSNPACSLNCPSCNWCTKSASWWCSASNLRRSGLPEPSRDCSRNSKSPVSCGDFSGDDVARAISVLARRSIATRRLATSVAVVLATC